LGDIDAVDVAGRINCGERIVRSPGPAAAAVRRPSASAGLTRKLAYVATRATAIVFAIDLGKIRGGGKATREEHRCDASY
jgi:hypothetical protein